MDEQTTDPTDDQNLTDPEPRAKPVYPLLLVTLALIAVVMVLFNRLTDVVRPPCTNSVVATVPSPDGNWNAVLFDRQCGASGGFSSHVSVIDSDSKLPVEAGNVLVAVDGDSAGLTSWGGPLVELSWTEDDRLNIDFDQTATLSFRRDSQAGVSISFNKAGL